MRRYFPPPEFFFLLAAFVVGWLFSDWVVAGAPRDAKPVAGANTSSRPEAGTTLAHGVSHAAACTGQRKGQRGCD